MTAHINIVAEKADKVASNLSRLMPNISGPKNSKRDMLATVVYSTLLYGVPTWIETVKYAKYRNRLERVQRKMMIRQCRSYRTVSTVALQVISRTLPIELMAEERTKIYYKRKESININEFKTQLREELMGRWQSKWDQEGAKGQWTKLLIPNIEPWANRTHGEMTYELSQFITGHGNFGFYLNRMKIQESDNCIYCNESDTAEHMVLECRNWNTQRSRCCQQLGTPRMDSSSIVKEMLKDKQRWDIINGFITDIFRKKLADTRRIQSALESNNSNPD
ncbi:hypothetical protein M8J77_017721 [Diaphorina citri]|nr:hypothetical protein M8J77_017721 [Diaphorina citri]